MTLAKAYDVDDRFFQNPFPLKFCPYLRRHLQCDGVFVSFDFHGFLLIADRNQFFYIQKSTNRV